MSSPNHDADRIARFTRAMDKRFGMRAIEVAFAQLNQAREVDPQSASAWATICRVLGADQTPLPEQKPRLQLITNNGVR